MEAAWRELLAAQEGERQLFQAMLASHLEERRRWLAFQAPSVPDDNLAGVRQTVAGLPGVHDSYGDLAHQARARWRGVALRCRTR